MKWFRPKNLLLPLALIGAIGSGIGFLQPVFGSGGRWLCLALLASYAASPFRKLRTPSPAVEWTLAAYASWCLLTITWSEAPALSALKAGALALVASACLRGGYLWIASHKPEEGLDFLWPYAAISLLTGVLGGASGAQLSPGLSVYQGASGSSNFLGMIVAASTPIILWRLYRAWPVARRRALWLGVLAVYIVILYLTVSRASYLIFAGIVAGLLLALGRRRVLQAAAASALAFFLLPIFAPDFCAAFIERNYYKANQDKNVLNSRQETWNETYDGAVAGGWTGLGYGVSAGADLSLYEGGLATGSYAREKANSQLGIVEETGLIGLLLYALLAAALFRTLKAGFLASQKGEQRVMLGLTIGAMLGMLLQSVFEAWWGAPGSPEFVFFFVMAGAGLGLAQAARSRTLARPGGVKAELAPAEA